MTTTTDIKFKPTTTELSAEIKKEMKLDPKTGVGSVTEGWYVNNLGRAVPDDIKAKYPGIENDVVPIIKSVQDHNTIVAAAAGLAFGQMSEAVMKDNKEIERTTMDLPTLGKDGFDFTYDRTKQVPDRTADGTVGTKTVHGSLRVGYRTYGTKSRGELLKVKEQLATDAAKVFGS
jgi:hypothetical protein